MSSFIGDYSCKLDVKGRVMLPSAFKKHLSAEAQNKFVVKKDIFEKCLVLYPMDEWDRQTTILRAKINPYNKEHNKFLRGFYRGTAELELDTNNRLLFPRRLIDLVEIGREVIMAGQDDRIEIWAKDQYGRVASGEDEFADLAEKILGGTENEKNEQ